MIGEIDAMKVRLLRPNNFHCIELQLHTYIIDIRVCTTTMITIIVIDDVVVSGFMIRAQSHAYIAL